MVVISTGFALVANCSIKAFIIISLLEEEESVAGEETAAMAEVAAPEVSASKSSPCSLLDHTWQPSMQSHAMML